MSKRYGSLKCASSRLAETYHMATLSPACIGTPPNTTSRVSVRRMCSSGLAQRTISSAAGAAWPSRSSIHRRFSSGKSVRAQSPWLIALRVVSLPGDEQEDEGPQVLRRQRFAVHLGVDERRRDVLLRMLQATPAEPQPVVAQLVARLRERLLRSAVFGVASGQEAVGEIEQARPVGLGDAHHIADDGHRENRRHLRDKLDLALGSDGVDDLAR